MSAALKTTGEIGRSPPRIEARLKVTGEARYSSDMAVERPAYAYLKTSSIALGHITAMRLDAARAVPGVLDIMTHEGDAAGLKEVRTFMMGGQSGTSMYPMRSTEIRHDGEIVAVVLAETFEAAREAAHLIEVEYDETASSATFDSPGAKTVGPGFLKQALTPGDPKVGDAEGAFASAPVKIEASYATPIQHHNAIELYTTTCVWADGKLTVYEPTQFVYGTRAAVATELGLSNTDVHVVSPFIGGGFGGKGTYTTRTGPIALAAKQLGRPVKLVATRDQGFTIATYRAETRHNIRLGATPDGRLTSLIHEGFEVTSRPDAYKVSGVETTSRMYACPNVLTRVSTVHADRSTPGFMRAPPEVPYMFALESAMDELAEKLGIDPVELRRINDTQRENIKGLPFSSRSLMQCYDEAAQAFGWASRDPKPRAMRDGDWLVGYGCATATYPTNIGPAAIRLHLDAQGHATVASAVHDLGQGAYTMLAQLAADGLGLATGDVAVALGDTDLPPGPIAGGSNTTASVSVAIAEACEDVRQLLAKAAVKAADTPLSGLDPKQIRLEDGALKGPGNQVEPLVVALARFGEDGITVRADSGPDGTPPLGTTILSKGIPVMVQGMSLKDRVQFAFGAEFVEVRVHARTGEIRVPRITGAFAAGRIVNPRTAHSQLMGGMIWGISSALHEATEIDRRASRFLNTDLAEYHVPVNADVPSVEVIFVPEEDTKVNPLGIKGLGELGNVGTNAAIANAVYHAIGRRIRDLPIRIEDVL